MIYITFILGLLIGAALVFIILGKKNTSLRVDLAKQQTQAEELQRQVTERQQAFESLMENTQREVTLMAQQVLERNTEKLKEENAENVDLLTAPLREAISEMRRAMEQTSKESVRDNASFREMMRQMMESNKVVGDQAQQLANVLRRDNQATGYMGEVILGDLLSAQGLVEGIHYEVQPYLRDAKGRKVKSEDTGNTMRPDVVLHYPQGQDVVIDSKVSMVAYERYVNAESPEEKKKALDEHVSSVRRHVNELAAKDYSRYLDKDRQAVDFVIMFMPFESSLQLALMTDEKLWHDAFEKKVFVTSEQNLTAILHMIHVAWIQNQQAENQQKVYGLAEQLLDRLGDFIQRYQAIGEQIDKMRNTYDDAGKKLYNGNQSVVKKAKEITKVGAKENPSRKIPEAVEE